MPAMPTITTALWQSSPTVIYVNYSNPPFVYNHHNGKATSPTSLLNNVQRSRRCHQHLKTPPFAILNIKIALSVPTCILRGSIKEINEYIVNIDLRISYTREQLFSVAKASVCWELPCGFDESILSDLQVTYESKPEIHELQGHESVSAGALWRGSARVNPERWDIFKPSIADRAHKSVPEIQKLQGHETLSVGRISGASAEEPAERWDSSKLMNADSKSSDSQNFNSNQLRRPWVNPTTAGILRNSAENPEQSGVLRNWSVTKPTPSGSEMPILKIPGSDSLLSRCSQPYRPPSYFKAMIHPESQKHDFDSNKTFGHAEVPNKRRATEESWRKASSDLKTNEPLKAIEEKQKSSGHEEKFIPESGASSDFKADEPLKATEEKQNSSGLDEKVDHISDARTSLEEHSALQVVKRFAPPISPTVSASSTCETIESCLTENSLQDQPLLEGDEMTSHVEKLQPQILEGGRFSALLILEDAENIDPDLIDETLKKGLRTQIAPLAKNTEKITINRYPNNTVGKTAINSSAAKASMSSAWSVVKPSSKTSYSQGGFVAHEEKSVDIASKNSQKGFAKQTSFADHSVTQAKVSKGPISENLVSSQGTKHQYIVPDSKSDHWFSDKDKSPSNLSSWPDLSGNNIWRTSTRTSKMEFFLDKGQSRKTPSYAQELGHKPADIVRSEFGEGSKFYSSSPSKDEDYFNFEINLPDEDSLITVDDTYIFQEGYPEIPLKGGRNTSRYSGLKKPKETKNLHHNPFLPDPWFHDSPLNVAKLFAGPSIAQADPWSYYHYNHDLFPAHPFQLQQPPVVPQGPQVYEPSLQNFYPARVSQAHSFYSYPNNTLPPEASPHHQIPCYQKEPDLIGNRPLDYQGNVNSTCKGMRGKHDEEGTRPTFSQIIQMQIEMAQKKLKGAPGFKQTINAKPTTNPHR